MLSACFAEKQKAVRNAFCPDQCCITLVLGHCTPVWWADILRSICNDTSGLSAYFAEQHRTVRNAFCLDQCCSALVLGHCTPIWWGNTQRSICTDTTMLSGLFCRETKGSEESILSWPVLQCTGTGSLHTCMMSRNLKVSLQVTLQCCELGLQSNTGQSGMHFVLTSAAVHW